MIYVKTWVNLESIVLKQNKHRGMSTARVYSPWVPRIVNFVKMGSLGFIIRCWTWIVVRLMYHYK